MLKNQSAIKADYAEAMVDAAPLQTVGRKRALVPLIALVLGALIGAGVTYSMTSSRGVPVIVQGTLSGVAANSGEADVAAIAFRFDGHNYATPGEGESVPVVAHVPWTDAAGGGHGGDRPACLAADKYGQRVELGVLDVRGEGAWSSQLVVWVHCLS
ncbi:hypothetical protein AB0M46_25490 [Dactylosporangium sp. NPDC051485]|uniref:hypothetical protein n=1 Tax=Dactylosporangium sp. NPDC051485 TaxID=3154846 RepID=UPI00342A57E4